MIDIAMDVDNDNLDVYISHPNNQNIHVCDSNMLTNSNEQCLLYDNRQNLTRLSSLLQVQIAASVVVLVVVLVVVFVLVFALAFVAVVVYVVVVEFVQLKQRYLAFLLVVSMDQYLAVLLGASVDVIVALFVVVGVLDFVVVVTVEADSQAVKKHVLASTLTLVVAAVGIHYYSYYYYY